MNIEFSQKLNDKIIKKAIKVHYFGFKYTYISPILGSVFILTFIVFILGFHMPIDLQTKLMLFFAGYLIFKPLIYINRSFKSSEYNKSIQQNMSYQFTPENTIIIIEGENKTVYKLADLYAYLNKEAVLLLYITKTQYFIIDKEEIDAIKCDAILEKLNYLKVKRK